jgi:acetyl-CoA/propionyl-CoA carboxylase biotin carboxyl carrier protein
MYDPMVAKLIVWDADREQATARMLRALAEFQIDGLTTLIPFHRALLASDQWARGETCRDLLEDRAWLKRLAVPKPAKAPDSDAAHGDGREQVEQTYTVEVSGRRFDVKVIGPAPVGGGVAVAGNGAAERKSPKRGERKRSRRASS